MLPNVFGSISGLNYWHGSALTTISRVAVEPYASGSFVTPTFVPADSLFGSQWHLLNTGQGGGLPGIDINVTGVWDDYTGAGVRVGVVDDGVQFSHHDLDNNYNQSGQFDYGGNDADPTPTANDPHGTAVAGLIAAENNGVGSVGVAFDASITAFRIFGGDLFESELADVYNRHAFELDVSNNSWGFNGFFFDDLDSTTFDSVGAAIENAAANGRDGLGTVMLWAAGNDRADGQDVNYHGFQNARETISVAAIQNNGEIAGYSTPGAAILVGAPSNGGSLAITTTDQIGAAGYSSGDYTASFGGTSAATPITAGVVALMLEADPELGYRDVQEILAYSARQVDVTDPGWAFNGAGNWNGGGLHTSHDFGFGLVDAHAAVRLAETWTAQSTAANEVFVSGSSTPNLATTGNGIISDTIVIGGGVDIDHVEVDLNLSHSWIGDLVITLTSPDGTKSVLVDRPGVTGSDALGADQDNINFTLSSTNHWGEIGAGAWTLEIEDFRIAESGVLIDWTLNLFGDTLNDSDVYIYTNEFANFAGDTGRQVLSDAAGDDAINAAAITTNSVIDLNDGADSTLAGNTLSIAAGTVIEDVYTGDGDDTLVGNAADNLLFGGRGDDTLLGGGGNDMLIGDVGDDMFVIGANDGSDIIDDFVAGAGSIDRVDLSARSEISDFAGLQALAADNGVDTTISFGNGDSLTLNGVLTSELDADDFIFSENQEFGELLSDDFDDGDFAGWSVVDQGTLQGPSAWSVVGGEVHQGSNIYNGTGSGTDNRLGTILHWADASAQSWQDYTVEATLRSTDNDGIGLVFYYTDENNYYKAEFDQQRSFSALFQVQGGVETTLASASGPGYAIGADTPLSVTVSGNEITVLRDGADVFGGAVQGGALTGGSVGFYSWGNNGSNFDDVVVTGNGPAPAAFSIAAADAVKAEGDAGPSDFTFMVTRSGDTSAATSVDYQVQGSGGNPADALDFDVTTFPLTGRVDFAAGEAEQIVTVQVNGDLDIEADEEFTVSLSAPANSEQIATASATGRIEDDDDIPPPTAELLSDDFDDGDFAGWSVVDQGTLQGPSAWSVVGGEVHQGSNIYNGTGSGTDNRLGTILHWADASAQSWQDYTVEATLRSTDNDGVGLVFYYTDENNYYKAEFDQQRSFSALFQVQGGVETTLASVSGPGYAIGADTPLSVTVSGSEITVLRDGADVFGGAVQGGALTGGSVGFYSWGNNGSNFDDVVVTGNGPAPAAFSIAAADAVKAEGDAGPSDFTFMVTRSGDTSAATSVDYQVQGSGGNPADALDFDITTFPLTGRVDFAAGEAEQIVTVQVNGDLDIEADEEFTVSLSAPANSEQIATASATGRIEDDDDIPPPTAELLSDDFDDGDFAGWSVVDQGTLQGPSAWSVVGGEVHQGSNIYNGTGSGTDNRLGTILHWADASAQSWQDYTVEATLRSTDNDGVGLVFYYTDENNYYKAEFDQQRSFSALFQVQGGVETTLASVSGPGYAIGADTPLSVTVSGSEITVLRDGADVFGGAVQGGALTGGSVGFYSWGNNGSNFDDVVVTGNGPAPTASAVAAVSSFGGEGDDIFVVSDTGFGRLDGGSGFDTLRFAGAGQSFDLTGFAGDQIDGVEAFDITGSGNNLLAIDAELASAATHGVNSLTGVENSLIIDGDAGDKVAIGSGWSDAGSASIGSEGYSVYVSEDQDVQVFVNAALEVTAS